MKDLKGLEGVVGLEVDYEVDEMVELDQPNVTIVMSKDTWREIDHFQEDPGVHT
jgi:hypothetical protein